VHTIDLELTGWGNNSLINGFNSEVFVTEASASPNDRGHLGVVPADLSGVVTQGLRADATPGNFGFFWYDNLAPAVLENQGVALAVTPSSLLNSFVVGQTYGYTGLEPNPPSQVEEIPYQFNFTGGNTVSISFQVPAEVDANAILRFPIAAQVNNSPPGRGVISVTSSTLGGALVSGATFNVTPGAAVGALTVGTNGTISANLSRSIVRELRIIEGARGLLEPSATITNFLAASATSSDLIRGMRLTLPPEYIWDFTSVGTGATQVPDNNVRLGNINLPQFTGNITRTSLASNEPTTLATPSATTTLIWTGTDVNGQDFVDIIFPTVITRPTLGSGTIIFDGVAVAFRDPWSAAPAFGNINVNVSQVVWGRQEIDAGIWRWIANTDPAEEEGGFGGRTVNSPSAHIASLQESSLSFVAMNHARDTAGHTITAGRIPTVSGSPIFHSTTITNAPNIQAAQATSTELLARNINTSGVSLRQNVLAIAGQTALAAPITYRLVDAQGNPLDGVAIRGIQLSIDNAAGQGANPNGGSSGDASAWFGNIVGPNQTFRGSGIVSFHPNGSEVLVSVGSNAVQNLNARFAITADVNFSGPVYVQVTSAIIDGMLGGNNILQIATVRPGVVVNAETTVVNVGFTQAILKDVVITETEVGDITAGDLRIELDQPFGWGQVVFGSITAMQARNHVEVTGSTLASQRPTVTLNPTNGQENFLTLAVSRSTTNLGTVPAVITLSGLRVVSPFGAVHQGVFGLALNGTAITNIATRDWVGGGANFNWTAADTYVTANNPNFFRWAHGPLYVGSVIDVGGVATPLPAPEPVTASVDWAGGGSFRIGDRTVSFANAQGVALTAINRDGRLFVPMRAVIEGMGGTIEFFAGVNGAPHRLITNLPGAVREEVIWTVGEASVNANGVVRPLTNAPFIADSGANNGSTFLPLRGIAEAHGLALSEGTTAAPFATITLQP
jgi:hypothetical protein